MGKRPTKFTPRKNTRAAMKRSNAAAFAAANRKAITYKYPYIATDYEASIPPSIKENKKNSYEFYANNVTASYSIECARKLNKEVDNARGNGRFEGKGADSQRQNNERKYVAGLGVKNIKAHCENMANYCTNDTINHDRKNFEIFDDHPEVAGCILANDQNYAMCKKNPDIGGGYVNIKDYIAEVQKHDPYCVIDTVVPSNGNNSGSGLHRVTIAPTIDKNGNVVIDPKTNLPKMTVYSFNNASKTSLEKYSITHGVCFNLNDYARHNLKEEYERNPEKTQQRIDAYVQENKGIVSKNKDEKVNVSALTPVIRDSIMQKIYIEQIKIR